jgi:DNA polymerase
MSLRTVLEDFAGYLRHELEEGRGADEADPATVAEFRRLAARGLRGPQPERAAASRAAAEAERELSRVAEEAAACRLCPLHKTRSRAVPGQGCGSPDIMFVGEAPGQEEDEQGLAFVGAAGQLLTRMIAAMGLAREEVFIGNILKCRPPGNRTPLPDEMRACMPYLKRQIAALKPRVIVALGGTAAGALLNTQTGITRLRGTWASFEGIDLMPTFHPSYLLRNESGKRPVWDDLREVLKRLGRPVPPPSPQRKRA